VFRILVDLFCGKKRKVEIARGETESAPVIVVEDIDIGGVTMDAHCTPYTGEAVVVGGDRHRPVTGNGVIVSEEPAGAARRRVRIVAFVDHVIDTHETPARASRKLPDSRSTHVRTRSRVVRGFHVRQRSEFKRHPERSKFSFDEIAPPTRSLQTFAEPVGEALLEPDALSRGTQRVVTDVSGPKREHARLFCAQVVAFAVGEAAQYADQGVTAFFYAPVALLAADAGGYIDALVHHREIAIVMQYALVGAVSGEYGHPEIDVGP
jgi:hypothetical protein